MALPKFPTRVGCVHFRMYYLLLTFVRSFSNSSDVTQYLSISCMAGCFNRVSMRGFLFLFLVHDQNTFSKAGGYVTKQSCSSNTTWYMNKLWNWFQDFQVLTHSTVVDVHWRTIQVLSFCVELHSSVGQQIGNDFGISRKVCLNTPCSIPNSATQHHHPLMDKAIVVGENAIQRIMRPWFWTSLSSQVTVMEPRPNATSPPIAF